MKHYRPTLPVTGGVGIDIFSKYGGFVVFTIITTNRRSNLYSGLLSNMCVLLHAEDSSDRGAVPSVLKESVGKSQ